jgi:hypothetical protein
MVRKLDNTNEDLPGSPGAPVLDQLQITFLHQSDPGSVERVFFLLRIQRQ